MAAPLGTLARPPATLSFSPQAVILGLFNGADALSYREIREAAGLSDDKELSRNLLSLSVGKVGAWGLGWV